MNGNHDNSIRGAALGAISGANSIPSKSDVQASVDRLSNAIAAVGDRANLLHTRLSSVLCSPGPASIGTSPVPSSTSVPLADQLNRLADEIDGIRLNTVQDALDRLHV